MDNLIDIIKKSSERVFKNIGSGHNEKIYQKALKYELDSLNICSDTERHINVSYIDSLGKKHCLETERIDLYVFGINCSDLILELKAIQRGIQEPERVQIKKYFKELEKEGINIEKCVIINFPQPNSKETRNNIDFEIINN